MGPLLLHPSTKLGWGGSQVMLKLHPSTRLGRGGSHVVIP